MKNHIIRLLIWLIFNSVRMEHNTKTSQFHSPECYRNVWVESTICDHLRHQIGLRNLRHLGRHRRDHHRN